MAQRLVRKLCAACSRPHSVSERMQGKLKLAASTGEVDLSNSREPIGCEACAGTGYRGRTTISEILWWMTVSARQSADEARISA